MAGLTRGNCRTPYKKHRLGRQVPIATTLPPATRVSMEYIDWDLTERSATGAESSDKDLSWNGEYSM